MACFSPISIEDLVRFCEVTDCCLNQEVRESDYWKISGYLSQWKLIAPQLKVTEAEVEAIEGDNSSEERRRVGFLKVWKQKNSFKATYKLLVSALLSIQRTEDARAVCQLLKSEQTWGHSQGWFGWF